MTRRKRDIFLAVVFITGALHGLSCIRKLDEYYAPEVELLQPFPGETLDLSEAIFTWTSTGTARLYGFQIDDDPDFSSPGVDEEELTEPEYELSVPLEDGSYYWRVRAGDDTGWGAWCEPRDFILDANPFSLLSCTRLAGYCHGLLLNEDRMYAAMGEGGFQVVDVSDPGQPVLLGSCDTRSYAKRVAFLDPYAYVSDSSYGVAVIDVSEPDSPYYYGRIDTYQAEDVLQVDGILYVADSEQGLSIFSLEEPAFPDQLGSCDTDGNARGIHLEGSYVYIADGQMGLATVDVSQIEGILPISGWCDTPGYARDVTILGDVAYVADGYSGVAIIDVTDPSAPEYVDEFDTSGYTSRIARYGERLIVADRSGGLIVLDVVDDATLSTAGSIDFSYADGLAEGEGQIYVADKYSGLCVVLEE